VRHRLSIFGTLVLWFTAASFLIVCAISFFLFRTFERYQVREQQAVLLSRMQDVLHQLESAEEDPPAEEIANIRRSIESENAGRSRSRLGISIREGNRVLMTAGLMPATDPRLTDSNDEQHFLQTHAAFNHGGHRYQIDMALDQTQSKEALDDFRVNSYIALFAGATLLALAGALVARRAMRPLARITAATQRLDINRLDIKLDHPLDDHAWPAELRDLAAEFAKMQVRLRDSFQRLAQFSDDLAHELRTPLNNLMGAGEVALAQTRPADEYRETLASMLEEAQRLRRMIDELLFLARAEQPEKWLERVILDAHQEASAVAEFFSALAAEKQIALSVDGTGTVFADRDLLRRALNNLIGNALQYTPPGGSVRIAISQDATSTRLEVHDTGAGIEARHLGRLFDRFYRVDESRSSYPNGTGLGLSIVRSIMTVHGGSVSVASEPGHGSTFTLVFPGQMTNV
jgi:two-component system heavy metal sensor histidine kinase CusS